MKSKYSMRIRWSEEDQIFVCDLPEFGCTGGHGHTYEEAARSGQEVLDTLTSPENLAKFNPRPDFYPQARQNPITTDSERHATA